MRENLGLQVAVIIFAMLTVVLSVSTHVYFNGYIEKRQRGDQFATELLELEDHQRELIEELQAVKRVVTDDDADTASEIQQVHSQDVQRVQPETIAGASPTYERLVGYLLSGLADAAQREVRARSELLAVRDDLAQRKVLPAEDLSTSHTAAEAREAEFARQRSEAAAQRQSMSQRIDRLADFSTSQSGELADARLELDNVQSALTSQLEGLARQYDLVRERWEATQQDSFERPDGTITVADARRRTVNIDLGSSHGLSRGIVFEVYDPDASGVNKASAKGVIEVTRVLGDDAAEGRIVRDTLRNPILSGDLIFTPLWQAGVQRQFCLLGILDIDGDGKDDGQTVRNLLRRQNATVEAEVDALGQPTGELTAATRYVVVGARPLATAEDAPPNAYGEMLARSQELGIDPIDVNKLMDFLNYRPSRNLQRSTAQHGGPDFRPRFRPREE